MHRVFRSALLVALLVFGGAIGSTAYAWEDTEIIAECGGDVPPVCRTRTVERCTGWYACGFLSRCCRDWSSSTVNDYFRD